MSTNKHFEFGSQTSNMSSVNSPAYGRTLMADTASAGSSGGGDSPSGGGDSQMTDPGGDQTPVWQLAGKALVILLVVFGLVLGGRWVWSNYSDDDSDATGTTTDTSEVSTAPIPLPIDDGADAGQGVAPEPVADTVVDGDIPALGPANPIAMTIGAAILAAALYRFSSLAHQPNRR